VADGPDVPLVVPEVNREVLDSIPKGIVANPNCTTMVAMPVLAPLHREAGLRRLVVRPTRRLGRGAGGVGELAEQLAKSVDRAAELAFDGEAVDLGAPSKFPAPIAHNVIPFAGSLVADGSGETDEEQKYRTKPQDSVHPGLPVTCTCVRVPVFHRSRRSDCGRIRRAAFCWPSH